MKMEAPSNPEAVLSSYKTIVSKLRKPQISALKFQEAGSSETLVASVKATLV
jgi:hypothetical protein